jgi:hypothetical protein
VTGLSDNLTTEIVGGPLAEGESVVTAVTTNASGSGTAPKTSTTTRSPLLGGMPGPR